jgi:hypothetical protein
MSNLRLTSLLHMSSAGLCGKLRIIAFIGFSDLG